MKNLQRDIDRTSKEIKKMEGVFKKRIGAKGIDN